MKFHIEITRDNGIGTKVIYRTIVDEMSPERAKTKAGALIDLYSGRGANGARVLDQKNKELFRLRPLQRTRRARPSNSVEPCGAALCLCCSTGGYTGGATAMSASAQLGPRNACLAEPDHEALKPSRPFTLPMTLPTIVHMDMLDANSLLPAGTQAS